jgi:PPOX class probable F420-dependent enzyme
MSDGLKQFTKQSYLNLETFRKNGEGVRTPVWFWEDGGVLYVRTEDGSGKVKRTRRNPQVRVTPCKMDGTPVGEWVEAEARLVDEVEAERINHGLKKKYGLMKTFFDLMGGARKHPQATLAIQVRDGE